MDSFGNGRTLKTMVATTSLAIPQQRFQKKEGEE
jgi:hypothetical protein